VIAGSFAVPDDARVAEQTLNTFLLNNPDPK
jgi:hypothetical protein